LLMRSQRQPKRGQNRKAESQGPGISTLNHFALRK
jgi:hypothetical protein